MSGQFLVYLPGMLQNPSAWRSRLWLKEKLFQKSLLIEFVCPPRRPGVDWDKKLRFTEQSREPCGERVLSPRPSAMRPGS